MDSGKNKNSETSSEENGHDSSPENSNDDNSGMGRSYQCTFCTRGFTNAQALGGHMNIHRKDKAKAKQLNTTTSNQSSPFSTKSNYKEGYMTSPNYFGLLPSNQAHCHSSFGVQTTNNQSHFPPSNPSYPHGYSTNYYPSFPQPQVDHFGLHDGQLMTNLNPRIGPSDIENRNKGEKKYEKEVDLELRLGRDP